MPRFNGIPVEEGSGGRFGGIPVDEPQEKKADYNSGLQAARSGLQGLTFGFSDEVGSAIAAAAGSLGTGESFSDAYSKIHQSLQDKRGAFSEDNPALSMGAELAGGVLTGGIGGAKVLGGQAMKQASNLAKMSRIGGVGAAEGAIYGAGTADENERLSGALTGGAVGALAAPLGAGAVNSLGKVAGGVTNYVSDKLTKTPQSQARQVLRDTADAVGLSGDEIAGKVQALGPEGSLADTNDAFRVLARAGMNRQGTMAEKGKSLALTRQKTQQARLMKSVESVGGGKASEYSQTMEGIITRRKEQAGPMYQEAFSEGLEETPGLRQLMDDKLVRGAVNQGRNWAKSEGDESLINVLHYAKQNIDDQIGKAVRAGEGNKARILMKKKTQLLDEIGAQNPKYMEAMKVFADESALKNAMELGRDVLKKDPDEIQALIKGMSDGELELFRLGGVKAIADRFDRIGTNADALGRIMNQPRTQKQLALIMGDDAGAFIKRAGIEEKFTQTRNSLTGNSTTALQQQAGKSLDNSLDAGILEAVGTANPGTIIQKVVQTVTKGEATPEAINALGDLMFKQGMSKGEIMKIFKSSPVRRAFGDEYDEIVAPYVRGAIAPAIVGQAQG
jgi:hypothetical protein